MRRQSAGCCKPVLARYESYWRPSIIESSLVTILIKRLEYEHVVRLDADMLKAKDSYVGMTRGLKFLTMLGISRSLSAKRSS